MSGWQDRLADAGRQAVAGITRTLFARGSAACCQLQASPFYEALQAELAATPDGDEPRRRVLETAIAHCQEIAGPAVQPLFVLARVRSALALLEAAAAAQARPLPAVAEGPPRLRLVQGGRA